MGWERCLPAGAAQGGFYINEVFLRPRLVSGLGNRVYTGLKTDRTTADKKLRRGGKKNQLVLHGIKIHFLVESKKVPSRWMAP